ncbi:MAG: hypothetical protein ACREFE_15505 [Limisphaerales bacterium]
MKRKHITGRELRQGAPEENLLSGESLFIRKRGGKEFELKRIDNGRKSILEGLDRILKEIPPTGPRHRGNWAKIIIEDRE